MKQLPRDEYGYINNRGRSRYWGVTVAHDPHGKDQWVVSYKPADGSVTHSLRSESFSLSEKDAALIGAAIYESGQLKPKTVKLKVLSNDKKWVYGVRDTVIWRERFTSQVVHQYAPTLTLLDATAPVAATEPTDAVATQRRVKRIARKSSDTSYAAKLANMILAGNLSERSTKALIGVLESTLKPKK